MSPRADNGYVDVVLDGKPELASTILGRVTTDAVSPRSFAIGEGESDALRRLREAARHAGAHVMARRASGLATAIRSPPGPLRSPRSAWTPTDRARRARSWSGRGDCAPARVRRRRIVRAFARRVERAAALE
jgi:hypothetical protein